MSIAVKVDTATLRKLLDDNAEARLELESMACEKIVEEIKRKIGSKSLGEDVDKLLRRALATSEAALKSRWAFPEAAKEIVAQITHDKVATELEKQKNDVIAAANRRITEMVSMAQATLERRFEAKRDEFQKWAEGEVRRLAREEFVKTLNEVRRAL